MKLAEEAANAKNSEVSFDKKKKDDFTVNDENQISAKNITSSQAKSPSSALTEE